MINIKGRYTDQEDSVSESEQSQRSTADSIEYPNYSEQHGNDPTNVTYTDSDISSESSSPPPARKAPHVDVPQEGPKSVDDYPARGPTTSYTRQYWAYPSPYWVYTSPYP